MSFNDNFNHNYIFLFLSIRVTKRINLTHFDSICQNWNMLNRHIKVIHAKISNSQSS